MVLMKDVQLINLLIHINEFSRKFPICNYLNKVLTLRSFHLWDLKKTIVPKSEKQQLFTPFIYICILVYQENKKMIEVDT
jgi:hypothetical protein